MGTFRPRNYMLAAWAGLKAYWHVVLFVGLASGVVLHACGGSPAADLQETSQKAVAPVQPQVTPKDTLALQVNALKDTLDKQTSASAETEKVLKALTSKLDATEKARAEDAAEQARRLDHQQRSFADALRQASITKAATPTPKPSPAPRPASPPQPPPSVAPSVLFEMRTLKADPQKRPSPPLANAAETPYLPVGCFADVKLATGVMATSQVSGETFGNPVLLVVTSPFTCPSKLGGPGLVPHPSAVELTGCFAMAKSKAEMATSRVQMAAEMLSCVMPNGHAHEQPIKAFVVGRDRRQGVYGTLERHESAKVAQALLVGLAEEAAKIVTAAQAKVLITGGGGGYGGVQTILNQVGQLFLEQSRALLATLTVESETKAYIVLQEPVILPDYPMFSYLQKGAM